MNVLPVIALNGLRADSLGIYMASLGLFSLVARKWPGVRAVWRSASFCLVGGPATLEQIVAFVGEIGEENTWSRYEKPWDQAKKADVEESRKGKGRETSRRTARWRALEAEEQSLLVFGAHLALDERVRMNPLLGTGGNAGQREFDRGWRKAVARIEKPPRGQTRAAFNADLKAFLDGQACKHLGDFSGGSWFGAANKIYNHGTKQPSRKGQISPWAMALACEGLSFFAGGPSRQLGSRRQPKGAFPFVTQAMGPNTEDEAGGVEAEIWVPIWRQPTTVPELRLLFLRGRAEVGGKCAASSSTFAAAILSRGIDAGIAEFRRFLLLHTTSKQTFESRLAAVVPVPRESPHDATTTVLRMITELLHILPRDRQVRGRWRFAGVRGPLEQAVVSFATTPPGEGLTEQAWSLVDRVIEALVKVDRNRNFRNPGVRFRLLPGEWATQFLREDPPEREGRLALAISSLAETQSSAEIIAYRLGVKKSRAQWEFPESAPARRVWNDAGMNECLGSVAERRVWETLQSGAPTTPFRATVRVTLDDLHAWLSGEVDEGKVRLWLDRLCVFDWGSKASSEAAGELCRGFCRTRTVVDGALALYALFRPLASDWLIRQILKESGIQAEKVTTCGYLAQVIAMLRRGDMNSAVEVASEAYRSLGVPLADFNANPAGPDPARLMAALIIPVRDEQVLTVFRRWRSPTELTTE